MLARLTLLTTLTISCAVATLAIASFAGAASFPETEVIPDLDVPFNQALARTTSDGNLEVQYLGRKLVYEQLPETYTVNVKVPEKVLDPATNQEKTIWKTAAVTKSRMRTVSKPVFEKTIQKRNAATVRAAEIGGGTVELDDLRARLEKPTLVLISHDGKGVPESFAILFKPDTLVLDLGPTTRLPEPGCYASPLPPAVPNAPIASPVPSVLPPNAPQPAPNAPVPNAPVPNAPVPVPYATPLPPPVAPIALPPVPTVISAPPAAMPRPEDFTLPASLPPQFRLASINVDDQFVLRVGVGLEIPETRFVTVTEIRVADGKEIPTIVCKPIQVLRHYEAAVAMTVPASEVKGSTVEGKPMGAQHRKALQSREIPVVVSQDGKPVDPFWQQNLKPKMLLLVPPGLLPPPMVSAAVAPPALP